jgi:hypothetical protein
MNRKRIAEVLAAHAEELTGRPEAMRQIDLTDEERAELSPILQLAEQLHQSMQPAQRVRPSAAFARSLGKELVDNAKRQIQARIQRKERVRRATFIGAAVVGTLVSIASAVWAIVFLIARLRARGRELQAPTS